MDVLTRFESMHMQHLSATHRTQEYCESEFKKALRKLEIGKIVKRSYSETDGPYVIRIYDKNAPIEFAHELRILRRLADHKVDFFPPVHAAFVCEKYGILVQDKWKGDILDLLLSQHENVLPQTVENAKKLSLIMMDTLHEKVGLCYGHGTIDFQNLIYCNDRGCPDVQASPYGFHIGLNDWRLAHDVTQISAKHDLQQINLLFDELQLGIESLKRRERLPDHLPAKMCVKLAKLHEKQL